VIGQGIDIDEKVVGQYSSSPVVTAKIVGIRANEAGRLMFAHKIKTLPLTKWDRVIAAK
jgi:hypothetical protein